jgi:hypothetical protein
MPAKPRQSRQKVEVALEFAAHERRQRRALEPRLNGGIQVSTLSRTTAYSVVASGRRRW